jgi:hypothetical protein
MSTPYRQAALQERCRFCSEETADRCARCEVPACEHHLFSDDLVCEPCQARYDRLLARRHRREQLTPIALAICIFGLLLTRIEIGVIFGLFASLLLAFALQQVLKRWQRRRFLDEIRRTARRGRMSVPEEPGPGAG